MNDIPIWWMENKKKLSKKKVSIFPVQTTTWESLIGVIWNKNTILKYQELSWMKKAKEHIDYSHVDLWIKFIIDLLNRIPFLVTLSSCEWHLSDIHYPNNMHADQGYKFLDGGHIMFKFDKRHPSFQDFLNDIKELQKRYSFISLSDEHHWTISEIEWTQELLLGFSDLTKQKPIEDGDSFETIIKQKHQVEPIAGEQRISDYKRVWNDIYAIAEKYAR